MDELLIIELGNKCYVSGTDAERSSNQDLCRAESVEAYSCTKKAALHIYDHPMLVKSGPGKLALKDHSNTLNCVEQNCVDPFLPPSHLVPRHRHDPTSRA